ncbi:uncharacterized protein LOC109616048 [Esox lucius]|nr:uncharacterized protein LOC109616048 [Esox lucius]
MQKQQGNVKQLFFPRVIAQEDPESNINMKRGMKKEEIFQESKTEETGIEKRTFQKEENPCPNENLIAALDINPILRCISDMESTLDDQWLTSPHKQGSPSPHKSNHLYQGQGEPHKQESCSAVLFPSTTQKPNAAVAYFATDKGKVKATPKKPADKRVTNKGEAYLGNIMTFVAWLNSQNHPRANCAGSLPVAELDKLLVAFFQYVWETSHLEALSSSTFTTYVRVLDHDLQNQGCRFSIRKSAEFPNTVRKLYSCCQHFKQREWDRDILVIQSLRKEEEAKLRRRGILSRATPDGLFNLVLLNNIRAFGKFHLQGVWPVRTADFQMTTENHPGTGNGEELEYLEWNNTNIPDQCVVRLHGLADNPEQCPLQDYKLYESKKAGSHRVGTEPMYCCPLSQCSVWDDYWFSRQAISKLRLAKIIKVLSYHILSVRNGKSAAVY